MKNKKSFVSRFIRFLADHSDEFLKLFVIVVAVLWIYNFFTGSQRSFEDLIGSNQKYEQLSDHIAQLEIKYRTQEELNEELQKKWGDYTGNLEDRKKIDSEVTFSINNKGRRTDKADLIYGNNGKYKYIFHELHFVDDDGKEGPPIGYVMIFDDGHVVSKVYKHEIRVDTVVSQDEDSGKYKILSKANFRLHQSGLANRMDSTKTDWKNIDYPLNITGGTALVDPTERIAPSKFRLWDPHIDLGLNNSISLNNPRYSVTPNFGFSFASYGPSKKQSIFRFIRIDVGYSKNSGLEVGVSPIMYNLGHKLPFISNTYIYEL